MGKMTDAPNVKAILRWFEENRPDIPAYQLEEIMKQDAYILLMAGSFEAGRDFQQRNPDAEKFLSPWKEYK